MCTGLESTLLVPLLSAGLGAAGSVVSTNDAVAQAKAKADARNKVLDAQLVKNDKLAADSKAANDALLASYQPDAIAQTQADATSDRQATTVGSINDAPSATSIPLSGSAPEVLQAGAAKTMSDAITAAKDRAMKLGALGGYGDTLFGKNLDNAGVGRQLATNSTFAADNMTMLPYLQDFAEQKATKPISALGGILSGLGNAFAAAGGSGSLGKLFGSAPKVVNAGALATNPNLISSLY